MARTISFEGREIVVPDDATDDEISEILSSVAPAAQSTAAPQQPTVMRDVMAPVGPSMGPSPSLTDVPLEGMADLEPRREVDVGATQLAREKVAQGGAPAGVRLRAGFSVEDPVEAARLAFKAAGYGNVKLRQIESEGPYKGKIAFTLPNGQETLFEGPSDEIKLGGLAGMVGPALPATGAAAGSIALGATPVPFGAIGGALGGGFLGETARTGIGRSLGVMPVEEPWALPMRAGRVGGLEAGTQAMFTVPGRMLKAVATTPLPTYRLTEGEIEAALRDAQKRIADLQSIAGSKETIRPTMGNVLAATPGGQPVTAAEDVIAGREAGAVLSQRQIENTEALNRIARTEGMLPGDVATREGMAGYVAPSSLGQRVEGIAPTTQQLQTAVDSLGGPGGASSVARRIDPQDPKAGETLRNAIDAAEEAISSATRSVRGFVERASQGASVVPMSTNAAMAQEERRLANQMIPRLTQEDGQVIEQWLKRNPAAPVTADELFRTLESVRAAKRAESSAAFGQGAPSVAMLQNLERGLVADRARLIRSLPNGQQILKSLEDSEQLYGTMKDSFWRSGVRNFIGHTKAKSDPISNYAVGEKILKDPEVASIVVTELRRAGSRDEIEILKSMVRHSIARRAVKPGGTEVDVNALRKELDDNRQVLSNLFTPRELQQLGRVGEQIDGVRKVLGVKNLEDSGKWFDNFFSESNASNAASVMAAARRHDMATGDNLERVIRGYASARFLNQIEVPSSVTGLPPSINGNKLMDLLNDPRRVEWMSNVFGQGFAERMRLLADAAKLINPKVAGVEPASAMTAATETARGLRTATFGQLSKSGAIITRAIEFAGPFFQGRMARALVDPDFTLEAIKRGRAIAKNADRAGALAIGLAQGAESIPTQSEMQQ
jgi:hypothetical protein